LKTKETFLGRPVDIVVEMHYIICIEDGAEVEGNRRAAANGRARSSEPMV